MPYPVLGRRLARIARASALAFPLALLATTASPAAAQAPYAIGEKLRADPPAKGRPAKEEFRRLGWDDLMPRGWDPLKGLDLRSLGSLGDADPRATAALEKLRRAWDEAPTRAELNGASVRLPGFIVPLDAEGRAIREFLLVPYFGACIHTPPPPANQVVHVVLERPVEGFEMMDTVWVSGRMQVGASRTELGNAAYTLRGRRVERYRE